MSDDYGIQMGLKRPATIEDQMKIQADIGAMRKAITFGQRDSALIQQCLRVAEANGLSGEETYVVLAYHALCQLEDFWQRQLKLTMLDVRQPFMRAEDQPAGDQNGL
jgi:hypothetical protein